jgi:hypothetical protein
MIRAFYGPQKLHPVSNSQKGERQWFGSAGCGRRSGYVGVEIGQVLALAAILIEFR